MKLEAKKRLLSYSPGNPNPADAAKKQEKERIDKAIDNQKKLVYRLKDQMPSAENRQSVSEHQKQQTQKRIHQTEEAISDLRLRKMRT